MQVSVQASPRDAGSWAELARRCEGSGFRALLVGDHPGVFAAPFVALAAAAAVTSSLRLGSYVVNAGVRDPLLVAADVATLDVVSGGRAEVGLGAGHTPAEWEMTGLQRPGPAERVQRLVTVAAAVRQLLAGETVPAADVGAVRDVRLEEPRPVQSPVPLLVGGSNPALLRWGGAHADAVGLSGLGRTLADGHTHTVSWSRQHVDAHVDLVRQGAADAGADPPPLEALVQQVVVTDDRAAAAASLADRVEVPVDDLLDVPYVWVGTVPQIIEQLHAARQRWGIDRWVVRDAFVDDAADVLAAL